MTPGMIHSAFTGNGIAVQADEGECGEGDVEHELANAGSILRRKDTEPAKQDAHDHDEDQREHRTHFCKADSLVHRTSILASK